MQHYDRKGQEISQEKLLELITADRSYYRVAQTCLPGDNEVSTVWLHGINHRFLGEGPPIIFETMVFGLLDPDNEICERYTTEEKALEGHLEVVNKMRAKLL